MDAQERDAAAPVSREEERLQTARRRGFGPLMLLLERLSPDAPEVGGEAMPAEEPIRLRHDPALAFPTGDVSSVRRVTLPSDPNDLRPPREVVEITTTFLGLTGTVSPLPGYIAEEVAQEVAHAGDEPPRQREFLDLFHHRILSLFHRAMIVHDPAATCRSDQSDAWSRRLLALEGFDAAGGGVPDEETWRLLRCAPLLAERAMTGAGLEAAIADSLRFELGCARVAVEQFVGTWVPLAAEDRTRLGAAACELGRSAVLGSHVFDRAGKFRVVIGPLDRAGYQRFSSPELRSRVMRFVRALAGDELAHEIVLWLGPDAAPPLELSAGGTFQLGRNAWLGRQGTDARFTVGSSA
jgi:type VI secretion system protein ImpH